MLGCCQAALGCVLLLLPYAAVQFYVQALYCHQSQPQPPYCTQAFPAAYQHIQSRYWNVGLFRYWTLQQLPNWLLAAPVLLLSLHGLWTYASADWTRLWTLGLRQPTAKATATAKSLATIRSTAAAAKSVAGTPALPQWATSSHTRAAPYVLHWAALVVICFTVLHVQVSTRFLCATPPLYWHAAQLLQQSLHTDRRVAWLLAAWAVGYTIVGTVLFCNFYPWT